MARLTLLTDFGTRDGYVGAMKGVIASIHPTAIIDDVGHDVDQGDVAGAALTLLRYWARYPGGTVHVVVVDPGVGTDRRSIAVEVERRFIVAPDNGVVSRVLDAVDRWRAVSLENPAYVHGHASRTFHGRDVFAPAGAYLARGVHLFRMGPRITDPVRLEEPVATRDETGVVGEVVALDRFGNLITNVPGSEVRTDSEVEVLGRRIPVADTYAEVGPREPVALVNSDGRLEVAARDGSAAELLDAKVGTPVRLRGST